MLGPGVGAQESWGGGWGGPRVTAWAAFSKPPAWKCFDGCGPTSVWDAFATLNCRDIQQAKLWENRPFLLQEAAPVFILQQAWQAGTSRAGSLAWPQFLGRGSG